MGQAIAAIIAIAKAVPVIEKWLGQLVEAFKKYQDEKTKKQTEEAVNEGIENQDQRPLEAPAHSGEFSGHGTIRDSLPGVMRDEKTDQR